jgi:hypothetical protein
MCSPSKKKTTSRKKPTSSSKKRRRNHTKAATLNYRETEFLAIALHDGGPRERLTFDCSPGKPSWRTSNYAYDALAPFDIIDEDCGLAFVPDGPEGNMFIFKQVIRLLCDNEYNNANFIDPSLIGTLCSDLSQLYVFSNFEERVKEVLREGPLFAAKATIMQEARFEKNGGPNQRID